MLEGKEKLTTNLVEPDIAINFGLRSTLVELIIALRITFFTVWANLLVKRKEGFIHRFLREMDLEGAK